MIERLVDQIEVRFADASRTMSDPAIFEDRNRAAAAGRAYRQLEPAAKLAEEWRRAKDDEAGAREMLDDPTGRADRTVLVGAHLDSVAEGPGINDNGSGWATILEVAEQMSELGIQTRNRVRFAFWGGEEDGLIGSSYYVVQLDGAGAQGPRPQPQLRHGRVAELRPIRLRR